MATPSAESSSRAIEEVIRATGCRRTQARLYLKKTGSNTEKAIELLKSHQRGSVSTSVQEPTSDGPATSSKINASEPNTLRPDTNEADDDLAVHTPDSSDRELGVITGNTFDSTRPSWATLLPKLRKQSESRSPGFETPMTSDSPMDEDMNTRSSAKATLDPVSDAAKKTVSKHANDMNNGEAGIKKSELMDSSIWDFRLPSLLPPVSLQPGGVDGSSDFSVRDLIAAIQHGAPPDVVKAYLHHFQDSRTQLVQDHINDEIEGFPAIFYVVGANNDANLRIFEKFGGDLNATYGDPPLPLLAFAIINSKIIESETSACVATLLSLGANADVISRLFFDPFDQNLPNDGPSEEDLEEEWKHERALWYKPLHVRKLLVETLNITQRYHLYRSSKLVKPTERQKQVARTKNAIDLFAAPYFLIGQSAATELLTKHFLHYMLRNHRQPLVLVFAGPSGHGKTELARRLGWLLSLELHVSDCTIVSRENELFGPRKPYVGAEEGSPLNNFLAARNGQKCVVFLDEFEKTTSDIWNALLIPFDKGEYQDRRNLKTVNCSRTIWILATNALDKRIVSFCDTNEEIFGEKNGAKRQDLLEELTSNMKEDFMAVFKPPLTGRISAFVPFLPFSHPERCVGAHKYLVELTSEVRRPINMTPGPDEQLLGNIRLKIRSDASVCNILTKYYDPDLGIRSLKKAVGDRVASALDFEYMATHEEIREDLPVEDYIVFVSDGRIKVKRITGS